MATWQGVLFPIIIRFYASFFGESYIRLPIDDASSETDIKLHFRTYRTDGLLLIAAGTTDYCVIALEQGMIRTYIDLGSGEASLGSPPGLLFNDNQWHYVSMVRAKAEVQLTIDNIYTTSVNTPGRYYELNINKGVFLGGTGSWGDEVFYGNFDNFRGCMQNVHFNSVDVFQAAKRDNDVYNVYQIAWECSPEFGATSDQPISFVHNRSYVAFPSLQSRNEVRLTFDLRTRSEQALVVYSAGRKVESDFLAVELIEGRIKLTANKGNGQLQLMTETTINDGQWHQVEIVVDSVNARITLDGRRLERRTHFGESRFLDLHDLLYLGGVGVIARAHAVLKDLQSLSGANAAAGSMIGCVQNFKINGALTGFREARVSQGLAPECVWSYPCLSNPCIEGASCIEEGYYYYRCQCDQANCFKSGATGSVEQGATGEGAANTHVSDVVHVQDLVVQEGGWATIKSNNIDLVANYNGEGIRQSSIAFKVVNEPQHGKINVDVSREVVGDVIFTMLDLIGNKVKYVHDGSESSSDSAGLELQFLGTDADNAQIFRDKYGFTLMIQIAPWNDKPAIMLPQDDSLVLVVNTDVLITPGIIDVKDSDDSPDTLEYTVQYQQGYDIGYFEISDALGVRARITSFTHEDVIEERIRFVHRGQLKQQVRLQVSDGKDVSDGKLLKVNAVPLRLRMVANTGLIVPYNRSQLITFQNLSFATNAPNQDFDIRFEVTDPPYHGEVQRQQYEDNVWSTVSVFTQRHIDRSRIRYLHHGNSSSGGDYFKYKVTARDVETEEYEFDMQTVKARVELLRSRGLTLEGSRDGVITVEELLAKSSIPYHGPSDVTYSIISSPRRGRLIKLEQRPHSHRVHERKLNVGSNFTQEDINLGSVMYRVRQALFDPIADDFEFQLHVPEASSAISIFSIQYVPPETDVKTINNGLMDAIEGDTHIIGKQELFLQKEGTKDFQFTVTEGPEFGTLQLIDPETGRVLSRNTTSFTSNDIIDRKLNYKHDDSESEEDFFNFIATPILQQSDRIVQEINELSGTFDIRILLKNDNAPRRVVDKVFHVVANRGRVMTTEDLQYIDPDINFDSSLLEYTNKGFPNGEMVHSDNHTIPIFGFTQQELHDGKVYFKHHGAAYGKNVIWVNDGDFYSTGLFEIQASEPYIRIANNTGLALRAGQDIPVLSANLSIESNLDAEDRDIKMVVKEEPKYGRILKSGNARSRFNMADIKGGKVMYQHTDNGSLTDRFKFDVKIEDITITGTVQIKIMLESHQHPPKIINNKASACEEGCTLVIDQTKLLIRHPETHPENIRYTVTSQPKFGTLGIKDGKQGEDLRSYTQAQINQELLKYFHHTEEGHDSDHDTDSFKFDVTNGVTSLKNLEFVIEIVPTVIPLEIVHFVIDEGSYKVFSKYVIKVDNEHYANQPLEYFVSREPMHGWIEEVNNEGIHILQFTQAQVRAREVAYVHDGSDTEEDEFSIVAKLDSISKQSNPFTVQVTITPKNDQVPRVKVTKKLEVWTGSSIPITRDHLYAEDKDSPPEDIMYVISNPTNGDITLRDRPNHNIVNFTQALINEGVVVFHHRGAEMGTFQFEVSDGSNRARERIFEIDAKPLVLSMAAHRTLEVFPGMIQPITNEHLEAVTNDVNQTRPIVYTLQSKPTRGRLVTRLNGSYEEVTTFNQDEIDKKQIAYLHTDSMEGWTNQDDFIFEVSTAYAESLKFKPFHINISYQNINEDNTAQLIQIGKVSLEEGGTIPITKDVLDVSQLRDRLTKLSGLLRPEVNYVLKMLPDHGEILIKDENVTEDTRFRQSQIDRGDVAYQHDHSDYSWDVFKFVLEIEEGGHDNRKRHASRLINMFNMSINPINDQAFTLKTLYPSLDIVQGFTSMITNSMLLCTDPDTPPSGIQYVIKNEPNNGIVVNVANPDKKIKKFTQEDVNNERIMFVHDGSMHQGAFYFSVSDGKFKALYKVFNIRVLPLTLELQSTMPVEIVQGHVSTFLSPENFNIITNGVMSKVMYNITKAPKKGHLYKGDSPVNQFSHKNIDDGEISYIQMDFSESEDKFEFILYDMQNKIEGREMNIRVKPLVKQIEGPWEAQGGSSTLITLDVLDASELATITGSNPVYEIVKPPQKGDLVKLVTLDRRMRRDTPGSDEQTPPGVLLPEELEEFSHEEDEVAISERGEINWEEDVSAIDEMNRRVEEALSEEAEARRLREERERQQREARKKKGKWKKKGGDRDRDRDRDGDSDGYRDRDRDRPSEDGVVRTEVVVQNFTHEDVKNDLILYKPKMRDNAGELRDSFEYRVSARNTQPAQATFDIVVSASPYAATPAPTQAPKPGGGADKATPAPEPAEDEETAPATSGEGGPSIKMLVVYIVVGIAVFLILIFIIVHCMKKRRQKQKEYEFETRQKEDSKTPLAPPPPSVLESPRDRDPLAPPPREPQRLPAPKPELPDYDNVPTINISSAGSDDGSLDMDPRGAHPHAAPAPQGRSRAPEPTYQEPQRGRQGTHPETRGRPPQYPTPQRDIPPPPRDMGAEVPPRGGRSPSPADSRPEYSRTVPTCKVTPLLDGEEDDFNPQGEGGSLKHGVTFDWENIDPELLQHCRTTNPVLHKNKYWV